MKINLETHNKMMRQNADYFDWFEERLHETVYDYSTADLDYTQRGSFDRSWEDDCIAVVTLYIESNPHWYDDFKLEKLEEYLEKNEQGGSK